MKAKRWKTKIEAKSTNSIVGYKRRIGSPRPRLKQALKWNILAGNVAENYTVLWFWKNDNVFENDG